MDKSATILLFVVLMLSFNLSTQVYAIGSSSPSAGGGGSKEVPPTLGLLESIRVIEHGFTIDNNQFVVEYYKQKLPVTTVFQGEEVIVGLFPYEHKGVDNLSHVELGLKLHEYTQEGVKIEDTLATLVWDKDRGLEIKDDTNLVEHVKVVVIPMDNHVNHVMFSFKFTQTSDPMDIRTTIWNQDRVAWNNIFENAIQVISKTSLFEDNVDQLTSVHNNTSHNTVTELHPMGKNVTNASSHNTVTELHPMVKNVTNASSHNTVTDLNDKFYDLFDTVVELNDELYNLKLELANKHINEFEYDVAIKIYEDLLAKDEFDPFVYNYLGGVYILLQQYDKAYNHIERSLELKPKHPLFTLNYAILLFNTEKYGEALTVINNLELTPEYEIKILGLKSLILTVMNENPESVEPIIEKVLGADENNVDALVSKAIIYKTNGDLHGAQHILDKVVSLDNTFYFALVLNSQVYAELGEYEKAELFLQQADAFGNVVNVHEPQYNILTENFDLDRLEIQIHSGKMQDSLPFSPRDVLTIVIPIVVSTLVSYLLYMKSGNRIIYSSNNRKDVEKEFGDEG